MGPCAINCASSPPPRSTSTGGHPRPAGGAGADRRRRDPARRWPPRSRLVARSGAIDAVVGTHASDVRIEVVRALAGRGAVRLHAAVRGGRATRPGVYFLGETPERQLRPGAGLADRPAAAPGGGSCSATTTSGRAWSTAPPAATSRARTSRWWASGSCRSACATRPAAGAAGRRAGADAVLLTLIGSDLVTFNRAFVAAGLSRVPRLCGALEENGLLGIGGDATGELYGAMGYFGERGHRRQPGLGERYIRRFGSQRAAAERARAGVLRGVPMLAALGSRAGHARRARGGRDRRRHLHRHRAGHGSRSRAGSTAERVTSARADGLDFDVSSGEKLPSGNLFLFKYSVLWSGCTPY